MVFFWSNPNSGPTVILSYSIALNDTASAGLGLQLKGANSDATSEDGLFIEKILNGGAASKVRGVDYKLQIGRLHANSRIACIRMKLHLLNGHVYSI